MNFDTPQRLIMASDEITVALKRPEYLRQYFTQTGREYSTGRNIKCPDTSAHKNGDANPSAKIYENANGTAHVKCFGCGTDFDIFRLWMLDNGGTFAQAKKALCSMFGIDGKTSGATVKRPANVKTLTGSQATKDENETSETPDANTKHKITVWAITYHNGDNAGRAYLRGRGISDETARRFGIGFDAQREAVIIPNGCGYTSRFLKPLKLKNGKDLKATWIEGKPRALFNGAAMIQAAKDATPIFIVEGEIDALSIAEAGGIAVATGGTGGRGKALKAIAKIGRGVYVPFMDRDNAGEKAQTELEKRIAEIGNTVSVFKDAPKLVLIDRPDGTHAKDANEELQADAQGFKTRIAKIIEQAKEQAKQELSPFNKAIGEGEEQILLRRFCDIPATPDQTQDENALIKGAKVAALAKGEGWIIAGEPGAGKSSFAQQFMFCAGAGKPCFGFEFTRPLHVLYLQSELQNHKLKLADNSLVFGLRSEFHWTDEEIIRARENVAYDENSIGKVCEDLAKHLTRIFAQWPFDLLVIDPLITFAEGDLSLQKDAKAFFKDVWKLIGGRSYNVNGTPVKFGVIILHHMGKDNIGKDGKKVEKGQFATAGSYVINAWARFQLNLRKIGKNVYALQAVKNAEDGADWKTADGEFTDTKYIKRAGRGERYWLEATPEEVTAAKQGITDGKTAEEKKAEKEKADREKLRKNIADFIAYLKAESVNGHHLSLSAARDHAYKSYGRANGETVYNSVLENLGGYHFQISEPRNGRKYFIYQTETPELPTVTGDEPDEDE